MKLVKKQVSDQVWVPIADRIWNQVQGYVQGQVWDQVRSPVSAYLKELK